jgi:hypothetical protein
MDRHLSHKFWASEDHGLQKPPLKRFTSRAQHVLTSLESVHSLTIRGRSELKVYLYFVSSYPETYRFSACFRNIVQSMIYGNPTSQVILLNLSYF